MPINMTTTAAQHWTNLTSGDVFGAVIGSYTGIMGYWFYAIALLITMTIIQLKTNNFSVTVIMGILISGSAIPIMPEGTVFFVAVMIALGIAGILYKLFYE